MDPQHKESPISVRRLELLHERHSTEKNIEFRVKLWVETQLGKFLGEDFMTAIEDGTILCELFNKLYPGKIVLNENQYRMSKTKQKLPFQSMNTINKFVVACKELGLPHTVLFEPIDLYQRKNPYKVIECLLALKDYHENKRKLSESSLLKQIHKEFLNRSFGPKSSVSETQRLQHMSVESKDHRQKQTTNTQSHFEVISKTSTDTPHFDGRTVVEEPENVLQGSVSPAFFEQINEKATKNSSITIPTSTSDTTASHCVILPPSSSGEKQHFSVQAESSQPNTKDFPNESFLKFALSKTKITRSPSESTPNEEQPKSLGSYEEWETDPSYENPQVKKLIKHDSEESLLSSATNREIFMLSFGIKRGPCEETQCACHCYFPEREGGGGPCQNCGHYPVKHRNIGGTPLVLDYLNFLLNEKDIQFEFKIGEGSYGEVWKGTLWGKDVAIKKLKSRWVLNSTACEQFWREISLMYSLRHPNVVLIIGACANPPLIVTELLERGSLRDVLNREDLNLDWNQRITIALDAALGMNYLHHSNIIHADLKSSNLLVDINYNVKVSDFGLSKVLKATAGESDPHTIGTPAYLVLMQKMFSYDIIFGYFNLRFVLELK
jgi:hypothetical protein